MLDTTERFLFLTLTVRLVSCKGDRLAKTGAANLVSVVFCRLSPSALISVECMLWGVIAEVYVCMKKIRDV